MVNDLVWEMVNLICESGASGQRLVWRFGRRGLWTVRQDDSFRLKTGEIQPRKGPRRSPNAACPSDTVHL
jgi:hypothetical protein